MSHFSFKALVVCMLATLVGCATPSGTRPSTQESSPCLRHLNSLRVVSSEAQSLLVRDGTRLFRVEVEGQCPGLNRSTDFAFADHGLTGRALSLRNAFYSSSWGHEAPLFVERHQHRVCEGDYVHHQRRGDFQQQACRITRIEEWPRH